MIVFFSKYYLRINTFKEHDIHERENTILYSRKESCDINEMYGIMLKYMFFILISIIFHSILHVLELRTESLFRLY
jgi:hypothetical protein